MNLDDWHSFLLSILLTAGAGLVWLIRLEARVNYLDRMLDRQSVQQNKLEEKLDAHFLRVEAKIDKIALRCSAFHSDSGFAGPLDENGRE